VVPPVQGGAVSAATVRALEANLANAFGLRPFYGEVCNPCAGGDAVGVLVRLAFHDASGPNGADGCIDFSTGENAGLQGALGTVTAVWRPFAGSGISLADTIALAGALAIRHASTTSVNGGPTTRINGPLLLPTRFGRVDAATCNDASSLPNLATGWPQLQTLFGQKFGLTAAETVALMGAHTLGRCEAANSGINGGWTRFQSSFDNGYFVRLISVGWRLRADGTWRDNQNNLLIKGDTELGIAPSGGCPAFAANFAARAGGTCPRNNAAAGFVQTFSTNTAAWWAAFRTAWQKMTEAGAVGLVSAA